jgi:hypothetical protein
MEDNFGGRQGLNWAVEPKRERERDVSAFIEGFFLSFDFFLTMPVYQ